MGRGIIKTATVNSVNEINFAFPYTGPQRGTLGTSHNPKYGKDVILSIARGQFLCGINGCKVSVRFDDGKAQRYSAKEPADYSTTYLFLSNYDRFVSGLRKAKKVYIEASFNQEATRAFEFEVSGLKW
jgi:hypothetical protein